jgi:hypothetical protein
MFHLIERKGNLKVSLKQIQSAKKLFLLTLLSVIPACPPSAGKCGRQVQFRWCFSKNLQFFIRLSFPIG